MPNDFLYPVPDLALGQFHRVEQTIKRSRFICTAAHVTSPEEAKAFIDQIREEFSDARHNCWAFAAGAPGATAQVGMSDDGEPHGTAGRPMLTVLLHCGVGEIAVVVTRYFGGILLGTGGLVRAYTKGAQIAVAAAGIQQMSRFSTLLIACPYNLLGVVQQVLPAHDCTIEDTDYGADVTLTVIQPVGGLDALNAALADATAGTVYAEEMEVAFRGRRIR